MKNHLLSIGIDDYVHLPQLYNAVKDAREVVGILIEKYQFEKNDIQSIYNQEATKDAIIRSFKTLIGKVQPEDNVIIYFSGHGEFDTIFNEGYWMPVNANSNNYSTSIPNSFIKKMLNAIKCHHLFVIVDSCFSGTLFNRGRGRVAQRLEKEPSRWGLTSGRVEIVADGTAGDNSPFAESFLYILKNNKKPLGVAELCSKVIEVTASNARQTPLGEPLNLDGHQGGQFVFHPNADEATEWASAFAQNKLTGFQDYLKKYPDGKYALDAKNYIHQFSVIEKWNLILQKPENTPKEISNKIIQINNFIKKYPKSKSYNEALALGETLEYKGNFLEAKDSIFKLRQFARKSSPFQVEAKKMIQEYEAKGVLPAHSTKTSIARSSSNIPSYEYQKTPKKRRGATTTWAMGLSVIAMLMLAVYFLIPDSTFPALVNRARGEVTLVEGTPPYKVLLMKDDKEVFYGVVETKGTFSLAPYLKELGTYQLMVEDKRKRTFKTPLTVE